MTKTDLRALAQEASQFAGTKRGEIAKARFELEKLEIEHQRNRYLYTITVILGAVAIVNFLFEVYKFLHCECD